MKKLVSGILVAAFAMLPGSSVLGQKGRMNRPFRREAVRTPVVPTTEFERVEGFSDNRGALVKWEMRAEVENVGFNVFRSGDLNQPLNKSLILGGAARSNRPALNGESYQFFDPRGRYGSEYVIESVDFLGNKISSAPTRVEYVRNFQAHAGSSQTLLSRAAAASNGLQSIEPVEPMAESDFSLNMFSAPDSDLEMHRWVVGQPGVKIAVKKPGMYKISCTQLAAAGFNLATKANGWRLFADGIEQAILLGSGDRCIEFYGKSRDTVESDTRVYYLISGAVAGKRIAKRAPSGSATKQVSPSYTAVAEKKERFSYVPRIINGDLDNYWGTIIQSSPSNVPFQLTGIDQSGPTAQVAIKLHGFPNVNNPYIVHRVRIRLNGTELGQVEATGTVPFAATYSVATSLLKDGQNILELTSLNSGGDINLFDTITVTYARKYLADQNALAFSTAGNEHVELTGFSRSNIRLGQGTVRVFDLTNEGEPQLISNADVVPTIDGINVQIPAGPAFKGLAVGDSAVLTPASVTSNVPSTLATASNDGQLVIIVHEDFAAAAESWAEYRRGQGTVVKVVDVADIFDEFSYGSRTSEAITAFLSYASGNWQTKPNYTLLLGDATNDPRQYLGFPFFNYVPTRIVSLVYAESGSDEAMADFNGDGLAEMAIGRIPVRSISEAYTVLNKTMLFETPAQQDLNRGALFAFDIPDGWNFQGTSEKLRDELPSTITRTMVGRGLLPPSNPFQLDSSAQSNLIAAMNSGRYIVNYAGHGSAGLWAHQTFFGSQIAAQLTNSQNPTIFTMLTCLNGFYLRPEPSTDSISDFLLKNQNGGAVATWASTADTTPDIQTVMGVRFYDQLEQGQIGRLGDLVNDAKKAIPGGADVRLSWALLGDPMLLVGN